MERNTFNTGLSFGQLISHTFPGFVLLLEMIVIIDIFSPRRILYTITHLSWYNIGVGFLIFIFLSTILGFIIDALQYYFLSGRSGLFNKISKRKSREIYIESVLKTQDQLLIYENTAVELRHHFEAYANIAISLLPSCFLASPILSRLSIMSEFIKIILILLLILIIFVLLKQSYKARELFLKAEDDLIEAWKCK